MASDNFPDLGEWHATRQSLHAWSKVLSAVRGALRRPHPRWWHISLRVTERGLSTGPLDGDERSGPAAELDLRRHALCLSASGRLVASMPLVDSPGADQLARWLFDRLEAEHGIRVDTGDERWRGDARRSYEPAAAELYRRAVQASARELSAAREAIGGDCGPVQLWAHHFDLAFERFGQRLVDSDGDSQPAQIGFGFFPGDDDDPHAYFYGTPWPFADSLLEAPLPPPAIWQKEPWEGARLPYSAAVADSAVVGEFLRAVHESGRSVLQV